MPTSQPHRGGSIMLIVGTIAIVPLLLSPDTARASGCGDIGNGDCCQPNDSPHCDDEACCDLICARYPFCCTTEWDSYCADAASENCAVCQPSCPGEGDCCEANDTPGCEDHECCELICAQDPFCCKFEWDSICANAAFDVCDVPDCLGSPGCIHADPFYGDCCSANDSPICSDQTCCEIVCAVDPFCCNTEWDDICADAANDMCDVCENLCPSEGDCCETNDTPGCEDAECCELICADDSFCCMFEWDELCALAAQEYCICGDHVCVLHSNGNCCEANSTPGCEHFACCECICGCDPFCCNVQWDGLCGGQGVDGLCGASNHNGPCTNECSFCLPYISCGTAGTGNCCEANGTPKCDNHLCCKQICDVDPFCCQTEWDDICADAANDMCDVCENLCPSEGDCCQPNGTLGCNHAPCCQTVCAIDPFCCDTKWDQFCANLAFENCTVCAIAGDLNNDGVVDILDLLILLENWGPCDDPSDCPADLNDDGEVNVSDLLILLENWT